MKGERPDGTRPQNRVDQADLKTEINILKKRVKDLERETTLLASDDRDMVVGPNLIDIGTDFFQVMAALRSLYIDQEEDKMEMKRISEDIESGKLKVDMTDLLFRLFIRQEIQTARINLILLSQNLDIQASLFDQLDDLSVLIDDPRYSVHQVILGWKRFEKDVSEEIHRHGSQ